MRSTAAILREQANILAEDARALAEAGMFRAATAAKSSSIIAKRLATEAAVTSPKRRRK